MRNILYPAIMFAALILIGCKDSSTGPVINKAADNSSVIDISHNGTSGLTFGLHGADQLKRFQTFSADPTRLNITGIDVKIRRNNTSAAYNNVTVELYETANNQPTNLLAVSSIDIDSLGGNFTVLHAPLKYSGLVARQTYAIVLGQSNVMVINNSGYEWCAANVDTNLNFGKYNGTSWISEPYLGDGWLKVYVNNVSGSNEYSFSAGTQVVFFDDFQRSLGKLNNGWINRQYGGSLVDTFSCKIVNDGTDNKAISPKTNASLANGDSSWSDYTLYAKFKITSQNDHVAFQFRLKDGNNTYETSNSGNDLFLTKYVSGWSYLDTATISWSLDTWHNIKIAVSGNNIKEYWDNSTTPTIDYSDASVISNGKFGILFWASQYNITFIDDVLVTIP
jgi:hypothetical protein